MIHQTEVLQEVWRKIYVLLIICNWLKIDIFREDAANFNHVSEYMKTVLFQTDESAIRRFDIAHIKISPPRSQIQGTATDTDMHDASFAALLEGLEISNSD